MTKLGHTNWLRFLIWLGIGLILYFTYSRRNSKLRPEGIKKPEIKPGSITYALTIRNVNTNIPGIQVQ